MWMVVGLGNPGAQYVFTRHNVGFMAIDTLASQLNLPKLREDALAHFYKTKIENTEDVIVVKPQTFMNRSGMAVREMMQYYKVPMEKLIVIHDELDLAFGAIKIVRDRGPAGHNGVKSINESIGSQNYVRIRIGIGRPLRPEIEIVNYALQNFEKPELEALKDLLPWVNDAVLCLIREGYDKAATQFNKNAPTAPTQEG